MSKFTRDKQPTFPLQMDPFKQINAIYRHGQYVRFLRTRTCPCLENGKPKLFCPLCDGIGFLYDFQREYRILDELQTNHFDNQRIVMPDYSPILDVEKVSKHLAGIQGGVTEFEIDKFDDSHIYLKGEDLPKKHEGVRITYSYDRWNTVYNAKAQLISNYIIHVKDGDIAPTSTANNPQDIFGDIAKVLRVYNKTKDYKYKVKRFFRKTIILDDTIPNIVPIETTDIIEVDYMYCPPDLMSGQALTFNSTDQRYADILTGDVDAMFLPQSMIKKRDLITFLFAEKTRDDVYKKSATDIDFLNEFDVVRIFDDIIDDKGIKYKENEDFILYDYNKLKWIGNRPQCDQKFSIVMAYLPTYTVWERSPSLISNENRYFPHEVQLRLYSRVSTKDIFMFEGKEMNQVV